ncbi:DNA-binding protein [Achromobacter dolens]|uniref:helix-turn-helix domain-containing transcriptional regulator n=1 Tax=Achromobacter dolens TaxID=1287738 RepID=UPI003556E7A8
MTHDDFDAANYLLNETDIEVYLTLVMENDDPELLSAALDDIARARSRIQAEVNARPKYEA